MFLTDNSILSKYEWNSHISLIPSLLYDISYKFRAACMREIIKSRERRYLQIIPLVNE